jgi:hypothetical protein
MTPTQLSLRHLTAQGYTAAVVEKWNSFARVRQDLFGFADFEGQDVGEPVTLIQTTTASNTSARVKKIMENATAKAWTAAGHKVIVHGWEKKGRRWELTKELTPYCGPTI